MFANKMEINGVYTSCFKHLALKLTKYCKDYFNFKNQLTILFFQKMLQKVSYKIK